MFKYILINKVNPAIGGQHGKPGGAERGAANFEKIICGANLVTFKNFGHHTADGRLRFIFRCNVFMLSGAISNLRQSLLVDFTVRSQRHFIQLYKNARHHVMGQGTL